MVQSRDASSSAEDSRSQSPFRGQMGVQQPVITPRLVSDQVEMTGHGMVPPAQIAHITAPNASATTDRAGATVSVLRSERGGYSEPNSPSREREVLTSRVGTPNSARLPSLASGPGGRSRAQVPRLTLSPKERDEATIRQLQEQLRPRDHRSGQHPERGLFYPTEGQSRASQIEHLRKALRDQNARDRGQRLSLIHI